MLYKFVYGKQCSEIIDSCVVQEVHVAVGQYKKIKRPTNKPVMYTGL